MAPALVWELEEVLQEGHELHMQGQQAREESRLARAESQQSRWAIQDTLAFICEERALLHAQLQKQLDTLWD